LLPPELVEKAFIARANCPEEAIIIEPEGAI
jgi:ferredoxin